MVPPKLPRKVFIWLAMAGIMFFALSMYLEFFRLDLLQAHPISVNLLSGVVGFCMAALVVGLGLNLVISRDRTVRRERILLSICRSVEQARGETGGGEYPDIIWATLDRLVDEYLADEVSTAAELLRPSQRESVRQMADQLRRSLADFTRTHQDLDRGQHLLDSVAGAVYESLRAVENALPNSLAHRVDEELEVQVSSLQARLRRVRGPAD